MAAVREMCVVGRDGVCTTEDFKQAEEEEHGREGSGDVSKVESVKDFCQSECLECLQP